MPGYSYTLNQLTKVLKAQVLANGNKEGCFQEVLVDSRKLASPGNVVFFALVTAKNNGHRYLEELYHKGVRNFVVSEPPENSALFVDCFILLVNDSLKALQRLGAWHRRNFNIPVIGITGSNGKTIVKEWLFQLMSPDRNVVRSPKSYNSQLGVPLSVLQMTGQNDTAIFEAGISEPGEMQALADVIHPDIGIFTNIGPAHNENFINLAQKTGEKLKLFTKVKTLIFCFDHAGIIEQLYKTDMPKSIRLCSWSRKSSSDLSITKIEKQNGQSHISGIYQQQNIHINIPFSDDASVENAIHCWLCMLILGYNPHVIEQRMRILAPVAMRLELKEGINNCSVINDSYNSDINSLNIALDFLNQQQQHRKKTLILSDILQSGQSDYELYADVAAMVKTKEIDHLIGIGPVISRQAQHFEISEKHFFQSTPDFLQYFPLTDFNNETILLKGARVFEFENINKVLQHKTHETVLEINLNSLIQNLNYYRSLTLPETRFMIMVKAFSYGNGSYEIANILQFHRVDYLAVAYADEGVELRKSGITLPVMVMSPEEQSLDALITHNLEPEIYGLFILNILNEMFKSGYHRDGSIFPVHIKLDTGMHRLGFKEEELPLLIETLKKSSNIQVKSVFSHLAASEDPAQDEFTRHQLSVFDRMSKILEEELGYSFMRHILNSAGISRFPDAHYDMVRLGIGLYGVATDPLHANALQQIGRLKTTITQVKQLPAGETIGYNRSFQTEKNSRIAILPIGYADGMRRSLGNGKGRVWVKGTLVPVVGNVCMDMTMIDITGINAEEGDEVVIFGPEYPIVEIAKNMDTIPYEVLTGVSRRVKRVYYHE